MEGSLWSAEPGGGRPSEKASCCRGVPRERTPGSCWKHICAEMFLTGTFSRSRRGSHAGTPGQVGFGGINPVRWPHTVQLPVQDRSEPQVWSWAGRLELGHLVTRTWGSAPGSWWGSSVWRYLWALPGEPRWSRFAVHDQSRHKAMDSLGTDPPTFLTVEIPWTGVDVSVKNAKNSVSCVPTRGTVFF